MRDSLIPGVLKNIAYNSNRQHKSIQIFETGKVYTKVKNKILEKTGFDQVFDDNNTIDGNNYSDYNSIKDAVHSKLRYG
mgnify:CR=1 FL=1